jgi:peroxiredoxin family protein
MFSKVDGHDNLFRDEQTQAILNVNMVEYKNYMEQKRIKEKEFEKIQSLENDVNSMKNDLGEIKSLLRSLIDGSK